MTLPGDAMTEIAATYFLAMGRRFIAEIRE
jgi:hypothetical protein